jgi:hypothetical protein
MSDIGFVFEWYDYPLLIGLVGWPGLLIGAVGGGVLWRRHRTWGLLLGTLLGCFSWAMGLYLLTSG